MSSPPKASSMTDFVERYGWPFLIIYSIISATTFALVCTRHRSPSSDALARASPADAAILWGANVRPLLRRFGLTSASATHTSVLLLALAFTKLLVPVKLPLAGAVTVWLTRFRAALRQQPDSLESATLLRQPSLEDDLSQPSAAALGDTQL